MCSDPGTSKTICPLLARRKLLQIAGSTVGLAVIAGALPGCLPPTGSPPTGTIAAGNISSLNVGTLLVMSNFAIGLDNQGIYAMSAVCTHAGCLLDDGATTVAAGLSCACHGSTFDGNGTVTRGPARSSLQHYLVNIAADGSITVDANQLVGPAVRTPKP